MTRKELLQIMPKNKADLEAANRIIELGYPVIEPVHKDMVYSMRVAESPVADAFAAYFAKAGESAVQDIAEGLKREDCWLRHRLFTIVFPAWSDSALAGLSNILTMVATHPDAYDNDIRCVSLLAERRLADLDWLADWVDFKKERWSERDRLLQKASETIRKAQQAAP
jgi:hypothetical protein